MRILMPVDGSEYSKAAVAFIALNAAALRAVHALTAVPWTDSRVAVRNSHTFLVGMSPGAGATASPAVFSASGSPLSRRKAGTRPSGLIFK